MLTGNDLLIAVQNFPSMMEPEMTNLSPAAQAILDATGRKTWYRNGDIAAALRATADQVAPVSTNKRQNDIRFNILRIAAELEAE
jgi:hypothetical protein